MLFPLSYLKLTILKGIPSCLLCPGSPSWKKTYQELFNSRYSLNILYIDTNTHVYQSPTPPHLIHTCTITQFFFCPRKVAKLKCLVWPDRFTLNDDFMLDNLYRCFDQKNRGYLIMEEYVRGMGMFLSDNLSIKIRLCFQVRSGLQTSGLPEAVWMALFLILDFPNIFSFSFRVYGI